MSAVKVHSDIEQGTEEWLELRRGIVTASTVGKLLTSTGKVANNDTSRDLIRTLLAERLTGWIDPVFVSNDMLRGMMDEPLARDLYSKTWAPVKEVGFMVREVAGTRLGYSPDGLVGDDGLIEIKSAKPKIHLARILADEVPAHHMAQLQAGMLVSGRTWCDYVSYCGGMPMWRKRVEPDPMWQDAITGALESFEHTLAALTATYMQAVEGLPATERIDHFPEAGI